MDRRYVMKTANGINLTMLCDFYELTMGNGYFADGMKDKICYFDMFFRNVPDEGGYAVAAGLEQIVDYVQNLHFDEEDIAYLRGRGIFREDFLDYLRNFKFTGDIWAIPEGTPIFPMEPVLTVRAPAIQAQLIETYLLLEFNHQSLIATKASRICRAAQGRTVLEFGSRRAQGTDAAITGARAAYIGGCAGTACTISDQMYGVRAGGTMAHSWVQMFDSEYEAFRTYCEIYPTNATLMNFPVGSYAPDPKKPYMEWGVGVQNIFSLFQIEYVHRVNYLDLPTAYKHGIRVLVNPSF